MMDPDALDALVVMASDGDAGAFDRLVEECQDSVRIFVAAHARHAEQIEEVCQVAWVAVYEHLADYRGGGTFLPWVKGFARNHLRKDQERRRKAAARCGTSALALEELLAPEADSTTAEADDELLLTRLQECLGKLAPTARRLIVARHAEDLPLAQLAQRFRRPMAALSTALWRIRADLRRCVEGRA